jgi:hypothetical protein
LLEHRHLRNLQTWQLGHYALIRDLPEAESLTRAKDWLEGIGCLGFSEDLSSFVKAAQRFIGLSNVGIFDGCIKENVNPSRPCDADVPVSVRQAITAANALDIELYEFARALPPGRKQTKGSHRSARLPLEFTLTEFEKGLNTAYAVIDDLCSRPPFAALNVYRGQRHYYFLAAMALLQSTAPSTGRLCEIRPRSGANLAVFARATNGRFQISCADFSDGARRISGGKLVHEGFPLAISSYIAPLKVDIYQTFAALLEASTGDPAKCFDFVLTSLHYSSRHVKDEIAHIETVLSRRGMIVIDDAFNQSWPHVTAGVIDYLIHSEHLVPLCVYCNMVTIVRKEHYASWFTKATAVLQGIRGVVEYGFAELCDHPVIFCR